MKNIKDKLILITGGASGIGQLMAFALRFPFSGQARRFCLP